ncbi:hypothetical protein TWF718_005134 [Orbilia javanica]|uniref:Uncharacterized protein n=1 Tax=Orbilia javanica TaxID=47235 RepID=A0AAN8RG28_9PEZI
MPDTPECDWYAFDQTHDIPANGAPFVFYATTDQAHHDATAVRCVQAGCKWVSRANSAKKPGTFGVLCNMCDRSPEWTPGADSYGFGNNPPPAVEPPAEPVKPVEPVKPAPEPVTVTSTQTVTGDDAKTIYKTVIVDGKPTATLTEVVELPKQTVTSTITVGDNPKTVKVVVYVGDTPTSTITSWIVEPTAAGGPTTVTKTIHKGGRTKTIYVVYMGGRPIRTSTPEDTESTVTRYVTQNGRRVKTIYVKYIGNRPDTTQTVTVDGAVETEVFTKYITKGGRRQTIYIKGGKGYTKTVTYSENPQPTDDGKGEPGGKGTDEDEQGDGAGY